MRILRILRHRLRSLLRRSSLEAEMRRELQIHIEQLTQEHLKAGMSEAEARRAARLAFGSIDSTEERCRDMRRVHLLEDFLKDVGYAVRVLRRSPGFTITAVLSFALGIGANTAIFSVVNAFLIRPLPFPEPERLVAVFEREVMGDEQEMSVAPGNFLDWRQQSTKFEQLSAFRTFTATVSGASSDSGAERIVACSCSGNLFATLGVAPALGRPFHADDDRFGAARVIVIGHDLWQRHFGGSPDVIGRGLRVNGDDYEIVGVMPRGFAYPIRDTEAWRPLLQTLPPAQQVRHDLHYLEVVGRVRSSSSNAEATAEVDAISARYKAAHPNEATGKGATVVPLHESVSRWARTSLLILLGAVFCVLLIACVNVANLMLTRALKRSREIGLRAALGAARGRIVRQLITETLVLAIAGGIAGALVAGALIDTLAARAPGADGVMLSGTVRIDPAVFAFALAIAVAGGLMVGVVPALRASRADVVNDLKEATTSATASRSHGRFRASFIVAEMALSLMLLIAAGLLLRSFARLHQIDPGIRTDHVLTMGTTLVGPQYRQAPERSAFLSRLGERLTALPGVTSAGLSTCLPLSGSCNVLFYYVEGRPYEPGKFLAALERGVDPNYFATVAVPLRRGRVFTPRDGVGFDANKPRLGAIIISESMAKTVFPDEDPIGKRVFFDYEVQRERNQGFPAPRYEIVGIVGDVRATLDRPVQPTLYRPILDLANSNVTMLLHTAVEPQTLIADVRAAMRELDSSLATFRPLTIEEVMANSTGDRRFTLLLFSTFAGVALLLAVVGLYGVVSYSVSQRKHEIGIRVALGATRAEVGRLIVMQGLKPAIAGTVIGLTIAGYVTRILRTMLFDVAPTDPLTFAVIPVVLIGVATAACYLPAIRAARHDPIAALRAE